MTRRVRDIPLILMNKILVTIHKSLLVSVEPVVKKHPTVYIKSFYFTSFEENVNGKNKNKYKDTFDSFLRFGRKIVCWALSLGGLSRRVSWPQSFFFFLNVLSYLLIVFQKQIVNFQN